METESRAGRIIGILILVQMVGGPIVEFVLEAPLFGTPGFLVNAASHPQQIGLAALLGLAIMATWVGMAITAFPVFRQRVPTLALWFLALSVAILAAGVAEYTAMMSMVSASEAYAKASPAQREQLETIRVLVAAARNWPHFMVRIVAGATIFVFYAALYRSALVPRALAAFGMIAAVLMATSLAMPFFGGEVVFPMLAPLGLCQLILAVWLVMKGFRHQGAE